MLVLVVLWHGGFLCIFTVALDYHGRLGWLRVNYCPAGLEHPQGIVNSYRRKATVEKKRKTRLLGLSD